MVDIQCGFNNQDEWTCAAEVNVSPLKSVNGNKCELRARRGPIQEEVGEEMTQELSFWADIYTCEDARSLYTLLVSTTAPPNQPKSVLLWHPENQRIPKGIKIKDGGKIKIK